MNYLAGGVKPTIQHFIIETRFDRTKFTFLMKIESFAPCSVCSGFTCDLIGPRSRSVSSPCNRPETELQDIADVVAPEETFDKTFALWVFEQTISNKQDLTSLCTFLLSTSPKQVCVWSEVIASSARKYWRNLSFFRQSAKWSVHWWLNKIISIESAVR